MTARQKRDPRDQGAVLIFVLTVVTVLGLATMAVAKFGFTVPKAAVEHTANQRVGDALDSALDAGVEAVRATGNGTCPATFTLSDVDGQSGSSGGTVAAINATVACAGTGPLTLTVSCNGTSGPTLVGTVSVTKVGDDPAPPLLMTSRNVSGGTGSAGC